MIGLDHFQMLDALRSGRESLLRTAVPGATRYVAESWDVPSRTADTNGALAPGTATCNQHQHTPTAALFQQPQLGADAAAPLCCKRWIGSAPAAVGRQRASRQPSASRPAAAAPA